MLFKQMILQTHNSTKFQNAIDALKSNNIHYTSKMHDKNERSSFFGLNKNVMFQTTKRADIVYEIYVSHKDVEKAKFAIKKEEV